MFGSQLTKEQKKLANLLFTTSLSLHTRADTRQLVEQARKLKAGMSADDIVAAFDRYWKKSASAYSDWYDDGVEPRDIHDVMWQWLVTLEVDPAPTWPYG